MLLDDFLIANQKETFRYYKPVILIFINTILISIAEYQHLQEPGMEGIHILSPSGVFSIFNIFNALFLVLFFQGVLPFIFVTFSWFISTLRATKSRATNFVLSCFILSLFFGGLLSSILLIVTLISFF